MAIETEQLIKIILGILVVIAVIVGLYLVFKGRILEFFKGLSVGTPAQIFRGLIG